MLLFITININAGYVIKNYIIKDYDSLNMENIIQYMEEIELDHIPILEAQIVLETGNLKVIKHTNNLFGFRYKTFKTFKTWKDCLNYKKVWQENKSIYYNKENAESYYSFLTKIKYATDSNYIYKLRKIIKDEK